MILTLTDDYSSKTHARTKKTQLTKFTRLRTECAACNRKTSSSDTGNIINLSQRQLSNDEWAVLAKGLNFAVPPKKTPTLDIFVGVEKGPRIRHDQHQNYCQTDTCEGQMTSSQSWEETTGSHPQLEEWFLHCDPPSWQRKHHSTHGQRDLWQQEPHDHQWRHLQHNQMRSH